MKTVELETAYLASGCFWGTQYHLDRLEGVEETYVGYMGGRIENPSYEAVKTGQTGHVETVMVLYNPKKVSFRKLLKLYFETHDFSQINGQGPDIGSQYRSVVFYCDGRQQSTAEDCIEILAEMGYKVATVLKKADIFWFGEDYHQKYYDTQGGTPYCHIYKKIF